MKRFLACPLVFSEGEPFYPIPGLKNRELVARYQALANEDAAVLFAGRLGGYRYLNMDEAAEEGMMKGEEIVRKLGER